MVHNCDSLNVIGSHSIVSDEKGFVAFQTSFLLERLRCIVFYGESVEDGVYFLILESLIDRLS